MDLKDLFKAPENEDDGTTPQKESPLVSLQSDLKLYNDSIKEVSQEIIVEGISNYPIFITHQHIVKLGEPILDKDELNTNWSISGTVDGDGVPTAATGGQGAGSAYNTAVNSNNAGIICIIDHAFIQCQFGIGIGCRVL